MNKDNINKGLSSLLRNTSKIVNEAQINYAKAFMAILLRKKIIKSRSELLKMDKIDYYLCLKPGDYEEDYQLPRIDATEDMIDSSNWMLLIPPFEKGVLRINKNAYLDFEIENLDLDEKSFEISISCYSFDQGVWTLSDIVTGEINCNGEKITYSVNGLNLAEILDQFFDTVKDELGDEIKKLYKHSNDEPVDVDTLHLLIIKRMRREMVSSDDISNAILGHFIPAIYKTNKALSERKPRPIKNKGTGSKVKTSKGEPDMEPKPKITRVLVNGIHVTSRKPPRVPSEETIRKYRVAEWNTRGHLRHYKNGKVTYIKPSVHHRKCLEGTKTGKAQNIIKVL